MSCKDNSQQMLFRDGGYCLFHGIVGIFVSISNVIWWFLQSIDLFAKIVLEHNFTVDQEDRKRRWFHFIAWGTGVLFTVIAAAFESIGSVGDGLPWCHINTQPLSWILYFWPIGALSLITFGLMGGVLWKIYKTTKAVTSALGSDDVTWWRTHARALAFTAYFLAFFIIIFVYRIMAYFQVHARRIPYPCTLLEAFTFTSHR